VCVCVGFRGRGGGDRGGYDVEGVRGPDGDGETGGPGNPKGDLFWRLRRQNLVFIEGWKGQSGTVFAVETSGAGDERDDSHGGNARCLQRKSGRDFFL
jgi:hypothetical protein